MDISFVIQFAVPIIVATCLCVGYIIKHAIKSEKLNDFIPLIMGVIGTGLNIWINMSFTPLILVEGLFSGLAATGTYEMFAHLIDNLGGKKDGTAGN